MLEQLRTYMEKQNLDGFFVQNHENVRYISGYTSDDAYLLITRGRQFLITDPATRSTPRRSARTTRF